MAALIEAARDPAYPAEIVAGHLQPRRAPAAWRSRARAGIATAVVDHKAFATREAFDAALEARLATHGIELVVPRRLHAPADRRLRRALARAG